MVRDHSLLRFKNASSEERRQFKATLESIRMKATPPTHKFTLEPLEASGLLEHYSMITRFDYRNEADDVFSCNGWTNLLYLDGHIYREMVLEFFSSVRFDDGPDTFTSDHAFSFFLGGERRSCSILELGWRLGIYTQAETADPTFRDLMFFAETGVPSGFSADAFWSTISGVPYRGSRMTEASIDIPVYRLLHRVITTLLHHSGGPEKVTNRHLFYMYTTVSDSMHLNFPYVIASFLVGQVQRMQEGSALFGGHFVTRLAQSYGILQGDLLSTLTTIPIRTYTEGDYRAMRFIDRIGDTLVVPRDGPPPAPAAAAPAAAAPVAPRRNVRRRQEQQDVPQDEEDSVIQRLGRMDLMLQTVGAQMSWMHDSTEQIMEALHVQPRYPWPTGPYSDWPYGRQQGDDGAGPSGAGPSGS